MPSWPLPCNVRAVVTTRSGGVSEAPYDGNNLATHVGDNSVDVEQNRATLLSDLEGCSVIQWLDQTHSVEIVQAGPDISTPNADGSITNQVGVGCGVLTADCLPVLMCDQRGNQVAAVHAGWRGLAGGIIRQCVERFDAPASELTIYLGPAIGSAAFEVGFEVLEKFYEAAASETQLSAISAAFKPSAKPMKFYADLYALARAELETLGVTSVYGGDSCTFTDSGHFYSYRRDGQTGRMLSLIWKLDR